MRTEAELLAKALEIARLADPSPVIFGLLKEIELLRSMERLPLGAPPITHIPTGEIT